MVNELGDLTLVRIKNVCVLGHHGRATQRTEGIPCRKRRTGCGHRTVNVLRAARGHLGHHSTGRAIINRKPLRSVHPRIADNQRKAGSSHVNQALPATRTTLRTRHAGR